MKSSALNIVFNGLYIDWAKKETSFIVSGNNKYKARNYIQECPTQIYAYYVLYTVGGM